MPRTTPTSDTGLFVEDEIKEEDNGEESELYDYEETRANSGNSDGVVPEIEEAFIPGKPLPKAVVITMTVAELVHMIKENELDLDAPYQRSVVWPKTRMSSLITSLIESYYIPPLIFNIVTRVDPETGETRVVRVCVDGKQRLTSVRAFLEGKIPCYDKDHKSWYYSGQKSARRLVLPEKVQREFCRTMLLCYELKNLSRTEEEDLFSRVQLGIPLNHAEKFRAGRGAWHDLATDFERDFALVVNLVKNRRSSGWLHLLACFNQIMSSSLEEPNTKLKTSAPKIKITLENPNLLTASTKDKLRSIFEKFAALVQESPATFKDNSKFSRVKTFAPIELVSVSVLIALYKSKRGNQLLVGDIQYLREHLREKQQDLLMNTSVWNVAWKAIYGLENIRGAPDGTTAPNAERSEVRPRRTRRVQGVHGERSSNNAILPADAMNIQVDDERNDASYTPSPERRVSPKAANGRARREALSRTPSAKKAATAVKRTSSKKKTPSPKTKSLKRGARTSSSQEQTSPGSAAEDPLVTGLPSVAPLATTTIPETSSASRQIPTRTRVQPVELPSQASTTGVDNQALTAVSATDGQPQAPAHVAPVAEMSSGRRKRGRITLTMNNTGAPTAPTSGSKKVKLSPPSG